MLVRLWQDQTPQEQVGRAPYYTLGCLKVLRWDEWNQSFTAEAPGSGHSTSCRTGWEPPSVASDLVEVHIVLEAPEIKWASSASFLGCCAGELAGPQTGTKADSSSWEGRSMISRGLWLLGDETWNPITLSTGLPRQGLLPRSRPRSSPLAWPSLQQHTNQSHNQGLVTALSSEARFCAPARRTGAASTRTGSGKTEADRVLMSPSHMAGLWWNQIGPRLESDCTRECLDAGQRVGGEGLK